MTSGAQDPVLIAQISEDIETTDWGMLGRGLLVLGLVVTIFVALLLPMSPLGVILFALGSINFNMMCCLVVALGRRRTLRVYRAVQPAPQA